MRLVCGNGEYEMTIWDRTRRLKKLRTIHEITRSRTKRVLVRVISCHLVDRTVLPENGPPHHKQSARVDRQTGQQLSVFSAAESRDHPALVGVEKIAVSWADVHLGCRKGAASQNFLIDEPFVVVFIKL